LWIIAIQLQWDTLTRKQEAFKIEYKDAVHWKYEMSMIELNKLGQEGWELVTQDGANQIYLRRPI
jgi:hypothetical protein